MKVMTTTLAAWLACAGLSAGAPAAWAVYEWGCDEARLADMIKWCVDPAQKLSEYQQQGRDNIIKGRYCEEPLLITDGTQICWNHDIENMKHSWVCKPEFHMAAAVTLLPEGDARKPANCKR